MSRSLLRVLGVPFGLAVLVGNAIGVGILRTPGEVAALLPSAPLFMALWVAGALYALLGALSVAELAAMRPRSGGLYPLVQGVLGPFPGFVVGWTDWLATCGSIAAVSIVLGEYVAPMHSSLVGRETSLAVAVTAAFALLQVRGIRIGDAVQQVTSLLKTVALAALAAAAFIIADQPALSAAPSPAAAEVPVGLASVSAFAIALQSAILTYDGWTGPIYFGQEMRNPSRDIPRAMIAGVLIVMAVYVALNAAFLYVIPVAELAGDPFVAAAVMERLFGSRGETLLRLVMIVSLVAAVNALLLIASRVPFAMSEDRLLPRAAGQVNAGGTPTVGLLVSATTALTFVATNTFNTVLAVLAFLFVANYALTFVALFVSRRREPGATRPFRVPAYPLVPGLALAGSVAFMAAAIVSDPRNSTVALFLVASSWPLYWCLQRSKGKSEGIGPYP